MITTSSTADAPFEERLRLEFLALREERFGRLPSHKRSLRGDHRRRRITLLASSAAAVTGIALVASGVFTAPPDHPSADHHHAATATTAPRLTTAYVLTAAETKLADTSNDVLEAASTSDGGTVVFTVWINSATGQYKSYSEVNGRPASALYLDNNKSVSDQVVNIDYKDKEWWSYTDQKLTMGTETPQDIAHQLADSQYTLVGPQQVNGENTLELTSTRGHQTNEMWVDAITYLPVKFASAVGTSTAGSATYTWTPASQVDPSLFNVSIPAGFQQLATPPTGLQPGVTGQG